MNSGTWEHFNSRGGGSQAIRRKVAEQCIIQTLELWASGMRGRWNGGKLGQEGAEIVGSERRDNNVVALLGFGPVRYLDF